MVFQPHRLSRTKRLLKEFISTLEKVDQLILLDIYNASESDIQYKISSQDIAKALAHKTLYVPKADDLVDILNTHIQNNDIIIFQGAGTIGKHCKNFLSNLTSV